MIGLLRHFFRRFSRTIDTEVLRNALFGAILSRDATKLWQLSAAYTNEILANFSAWQMPPKHLHGDDVALQNWGDCLSAIAETLSMQGHPEVKNMLTGGIDLDMDLRFLAEEMAKAEEYCHSGKFDEGLSVLTALVPLLAETSGAHANRARAKLFSAIASVDLQLEQFNEARIWTQRALEECEASGDNEGIFVYRKNLEFIEIKAALKADDPAFKRELTEALRLSDRQQYEASNAILQRLLARSNSPSGPTRHLAKIKGTIGFNLFRLNDLPAAREFTANALDESRSSGDDEGIRIYSFNLEFMDSKTVKTVG
jgi:tetratricopeptide (TPR) repeat protein